MANDEKLNDLVHRLESVTCRLEAINKPSAITNVQTPTAATTAEAPKLVKLFDEVLNGPLSEFVRVSEKIGGDVKELGNLTKCAFDSQRLFLWKACGIAKPSDDQQSNLLKPVSDKIESILNFKNAKKSSPFSNHMSAIAEGIPALGWITVSPTPAPYIKEMSDASQFYTNRVLKDYKEKEPIHAEWVKAWLQCLSELQKYVKQHHTTGLMWNTAPGSAPVFVGAPQIRGPPAPPPPPGPPPPPVCLSGDSKSSSESADDRAALFADINKGLDITKGLKKVSDDMKTHKNPELRAKSAAAGQPPPKPPKPSHLSNGSSSPASRVSPVPQAAGAPPKLELEGGKKWIVTLGIMPTLLIQKTDGCQVYLSPKSLQAEIVTSKSSEMNILVPDQQGEYREFPVPEQYRTVWTGQKLDTTVVDIA